MRTQTPTNRPARVVALHTEIQPAQYYLETAICVIGRADICQIVIPNKIVSRIQAIVEQDEPGSYTLHDNNSANGTYVNGERIRETHRLKDQDEIGLGAPVALLRFESFASTVPGEQA